MRLVAFETEGAEVVDKVYINPEQVTAVHAYSGKPDESVIYVRGNVCDWHVKGSASAVVTKLQAASHVTLAVRT